MIDDNPSSDLVTWTIHAVSLVMSRTIYSDVDHKGELVVEAMPFTARRRMAMRRWGDEGSGRCGDNTPLHVAVSWPWVGLILFGLCGFYP